MQSLSQHSDDVDNVFINVGNDKVRFTEANNDHISHIVLADSAVTTTIKNQKQNICFS